MCHLHPGWDRTWLLAKVGACEFENRYRELLQGSSGQEKNRPEPGCRRKAVETLFPCVFVPRV